MARDFISRPNQKYELIYRTDSVNDSVALFIHGLDQSYLDWGDLRSLLLREADFDTIFEHWDFLFVGYDSARVESYIDIARTISTRILSCDNGTLGNSRRYSRFALVGYSLGTLGIRQLICATSLQHKVARAPHLRSLLLAPPHAGSHLAPFIAFKPIKGALMPNNPQLRMLRYWTKDAYLSNASIWPPVQVVCGDADRVVGSTASAEFAEMFGDNPLIEIAGGHLGMIKIRSLQDEVVDRLRDLLA